MGSLNGILLQGEFLWASVVCACILFKYFICQCTFTAGVWRNESKVKSSAESWRRSLISNINFLQPESAKRYTFKCKLYTISHRVHRSSSVFGASRSAYLLND